MNVDLDGRTALVTGSARRIGRAIAMELARNGAAVMINSRSDEDSARATAEDIRAAGGRASHCLADVTNPADVRRLVDRTVEEFGSLDILVNNAAARPNAPIGEISPEEWRQVVSIVIDGAFYCGQAAFPHLTASAFGGRIISIGGAGAHLGVPNRIHVLTSKSGLVGMTKGFAAELGGTGTANLVVPGRIEDESDDKGQSTARAKRVPMDRVPAGRAGHPRDVASAVAYLASSDAGYITGQALHVNGGLYLP